MELNVLLASKDRVLTKTITNKIKECPNIKITISSSGFGVIIKTINEKKINVLLIDVRILRTHVLLCMKALRTRYKDLKIIMISDTTDYLDISFDILAVGYLIRPLYEKQIENCFKRIRKYESISNSIPFLIHFKGEEVFLNINDIMLIESLKRKCIIHTADGEYQSYKSIKDFRCELPTDCFLQSHRSFIINTSKIKKIEQYNKTSYNVILLNDKRALITKKSLKKLKEILWKDLVV